MTIPLSALLMYFSLLSGINVLKSMAIASLYQRISSNPTQLDLQVKWTGRPGDAKTFFSVITYKNMVFIVNTDEVDKTCFTKWQLQRWLHNEHRRDLIYSILQYARPLSEILMGCYISLENFIKEDNNSFFANKTRHNMQVSSVQIAENVITLKCKRVLLVVKAS